MDTQTLYSLGTTLAFAGILIIIVATALIVLSKNRKKGNVKGAGAIIIGPIPIVFGTDKESLKTVLLLSIGLTALLIILILVLHFLSR
ncbi:MAG: DUF131 domain-containing protein [Candidatus Bathyarchaeia archaeon]|jgi:uncharacterized protein (TIGR00304 family)